jgi:quinol monooxygenase YgiN
MANRKRSKSPRSKKKSKSTRRSSAKLKTPKLPKDAVLLIVMLHARPGQESLLQAELTALVRPSRKEEGSLAYDLYRSAAAPGDFLFSEIWASRDAHAAHRRTPHFQRWNARKDTLLLSRESTFWKQIA